MREAASAPLVQPPAVERPSLVRLALPWGAAAAVWLVLFRQISPEWTSTPQYSYGWFVPLLAAWTGWQRWRSRPEPGPAPAPSLLGGLFVAGLLALGPVLWVQAGNRDWRLVGWALALDAIGLSLLAVAWCGGWRWARHFLFPLLFPLVAAPWPSTIESPLTQNMMKVVASAAAGALQLGGVPAASSGNLIMLPSGPVGVDEACSGIQSFQGSVMVAFFLGEYFAFFASERLLLVLFAAALAFVGNMLRAGFLAAMAHRGGPAAVDWWHDPAGYALMLLCYAGIFLFADRWARTGEGEPPEEAVVARPPTTVRGRLAPAALSAATLCWLAAVCVATEWWYRRGEAGARLRGWVLNLDEPSLGRVRDFSERERTLLRYDTSAGREWDDPQGRHWAVNFFRWELGNAGADNARFHRPTLCLSSTGYDLDGAEPNWTFEKDGVRLTIRQFHFHSGDHVLDSFYCLWDPMARPGYSDPTGDWDPSSWSASARIANVLAGRRGGELQMINAGVYGAASPAEATAAFRDLLNRLVVPAK